MLTTAMYNALQRAMTTNGIDDMTKEEMLNHLSRGACLVEFRKLDGDHRKMLCTRSVSLIKSYPDAYLPTGAGRPEPEDQVKAFDINKGEWRSFKVDRVQRFVGINFEYINPLV